MRLKRKQCHSSKRFVSSLSLCVFVVGLQANHKDTKARRRHREYEIEKGASVLTAEQLLDKINKLRKDYSDDEEDETYQALHHALLFMSYKIGLLKEYLQEAAKTPGE